MDDTLSLIAIECIRSYTLLYDFSHCVHLWVSLTSNTMIQRLSQTPSYRRCIDPSVFDKTNTNASLACHPPRYPLTVDNSLLNEYTHASEDV
jgi:hypothetical protein